MDEMRFYPRPDAPAIGLFGFIRLIPLDPDIRASAGDEWVSVPFDAAIWSALDLGGCDPRWGRADDTDVALADLPRLAHWLDRRAPHLPAPFLADLRDLIDAAIAHATALDILLWR